MRYTNYDEQDMVADAEQDLRAYPVPEYTAAELCACAGSTPGPNVVAPDYFGDLEPF